MEIRDAELSDARLITDLENFAYRDLDPDLLMEGHTLQKEERVHFAMASNHERGVIAEDQGEICGVSMWGPIGTPVSTSNLHLLFIHPDYQRIGLGLRLLQIHWERSLESWPKLKLFTLNCNRGSYWALSFYAKHGYLIYAPGDEDRVPGMREYRDSPPAPGRPIHPPYWADHYLPANAVRRHLSK